MGFIGNKPKVSPSSVASTIAAPVGGVLTYDGSKFVIVDMAVATENDTLDSIANLGNMILTNTANINKIQIMGVNDENSMGDY